MDAPKEAEASAHPLPDYEHPVHEEVPDYEHAPDYEHTTISMRVQGLPTGLNLTIDPTGLSVKALNGTDSAPLYVLNNSMLKARGSTASIHVQRPASNGGDPVTLYAIGEHFISALLKPKNKELRAVTAARSHGALVTINIREIVWDFSTRVPAPKGDNVATNSGYSYPTDPVYMIGTGAGPGTVEKHLLQFRKGQVFNSDDEVIALEREASHECEGMPMLSLTKELDQETMDFLVSAWLVTLWGQVGRRARRQSKNGSGSGSGSGRRLSIGKFKILG